MNNNLEPVRDYEEELDLKQMFLCILRRWRVILIGMLIVGVIAGGYKLIAGLKSISEDTGTPATTEKTQVEEYQEQMDKLNEQIDNQLEYINNSIYMNIDAYAVDYAELLYYIDTDYTVMPSMTYQNIDYTDRIVNSFVSVLNNSEYMLKLADSFGVDFKYVKELVSINNAGSGLLKITVVADTKNRVDKIVDCIKSGIDDYTATARETISDFTISLIDSASYEMINTSVLDSQQSQLDRLDSLENSYEDVKESYEEYLESSKAQPSELTKASAAKDAVKYGVIGLVIGIMLVCAFYVCGFIFGNTLYSADALKDRTGLSIIASYTEEGGNYGRLDSFLRKCEGRDVCMDKETAAGLTAAYIKSLSKDGSIFIAGSTAAETVKALAESIADVAGKEKVSFCGSLITDPQAVSECSASEGVILIEQCGVSKYSDINREIEVAHKLNKNVLGCLVIDK